MHLIIKYLLLTQLLYYKIGFCDATKSDIQVNVEYLTSNFFENLGESISLKDEGLDDFWLEQFIDTQTSNFISLMRQSHGKFEHKVTRRSAKEPSFVRDNIGVYVLNGFEEKLNVPGNHPKEIVLFQNQYETNRLWYMAVLDKKANSTECMIYVLNNYFPTALHRIEALNNDVKLAILSTLGSTYIILIENNVEDIFHDKLGVYKFTADELLVKVQNLNNASDVILWEQDGETYLALLQSPQENSYEVKIIIYKWLGDYFDNVDVISTYGSRKITPFSIGTSHYLAIAKYQDDLGNTKTHSEIYKFNLNLEKFELYQKILTNAAVDVKYFSFRKDYMEESFIAFANFFAIDVAGNTNYDTDSIIYKYVDNYFIPFQNIILSGALEWLPVSGVNSEFLLLVSSKFEGIKSFQYNGWQFVESGVQYTNGAFNVGVNKMRNYLVDEMPVIVIMSENDDGDLTNIFEPKFNHRNMLNNFQNEALSWCQGQVKKAESYNLDFFGNTPKDLEWFHKAFENYTREKRDIDDLYQVTFDTDESTVKDLQNTVELYHKDLDKIEQQVESSLRRSENITFKNLKVENIIINNKIQEFPSIYAITLNDMEIDDLLNNTLDIENGFQTDVLTFDTITIQNHFPLNITNWRNFNESKIRDIHVNGSATFNRGLRIDGLLNGINLNSKNVLLKKGDQSFNKLIVDSLYADKITAKAINNKNLFQLDVPNTEPLTYDSINISNVVLHGFINQVDISSLNTNALKLNGNQTITAPFSFKSLRAKNVNVKLLSEKRIPEDLFLINEGQYAFPQETHFAVNFAAKKLFITEQLNNIKVTNGNFAMLMGDVDYVQHVNGFITSENIEFVDNINLRGPINDILSYDFSPVKEINKTILLKGDYFINAGIQIKEIMRTSDILTSQPNLTVKRLQEKGLKINDSVVPVHLNFSQQLNVHEIFVDKINDVDVTSFIITGTDDQQVVSGRKTFSQNLTVTGSTKLYYVNGINFRDYDLAILNVYGNQTLTGKIYFENVIANRVANIKTKFQDKMWNDVITTDGHQFISGTTIITNSSKFSQLETTSLLCNSVINGFNFSEIMDDTIFKNKSVKMADLDFVDLEVENLYIENYNLDYLQELTSNNVSFEFDEELNLPENISIQNIVFDYNFNGIPAKNFGFQLQKQKDQDILSPQNIKKMIINGQVFIDSNSINDISIEDLVNNTVKIDEQVHFHSAKFLKKITSLNGIKLEGLFESLDLQDIVQSNVENEQMLRNKVVFKEDVNVNGEIFSNSLISGFNLNQLCNYVFGSASKPLKNLVIEGNAYFARSPKINHINNYLVPYILNNTWFTDTEASISGKFEFGKIEFQDDLIVEGYLDNVKTQLVAQTYLSKTRNQTVMANFEIEDVTFKQGISAQKAFVKGEVGTINLEEFTRTVILNNYQQVFEMRTYFDTIEMLNVKGDYLVNALNLSTDVMRYDKFNMVTGKKTVRDVTTHEIKMDKPTNIKNVDFFKWLGSCVLRNGTFHVPGKLEILNDSKFLGDLNTKCPINNLTFDQNNVMLKSGNQVINGQKTFYKNPVELSSVKLNGLLNGVNVHDLMYYQVYQNTEIAFNSPIQIDAELKAQNVNVKKRYKGVNVEQLISNITKANAINNYENIYEHLLKDTLIITESLKAQAFFLDYYEKVEKYESISYIYPLHFANSKFQNLGCIYIDDQNYSIIFQVWDENTQRFDMKPELESIYVKKKLIYVKQITFNGVDCWYMEHKINSGPSNSNQFQGGIYQISKTKIKQLVPSIFHNGTQSVAAFSIPDQRKECLLVLFETKTELFCGSTNSWRITEHIRTVDQSNGIKALTSVINGIQYFFILSEGNVKEGPSVSIWQYNPTNQEFDCIQIIKVSIAKDISTISFQGVHYLAITSGNISNAECAESELLDIRKFDLTSNSFITSQEFIVNKPLKLEFAQLPTKELVLYVLSSNSQVPLQLFVYEGVSGFQKKNVALTMLIEDSVGIESFTTLSNEHFVIIKCKNEIWILQGIFKGQKYTQ